MANKISKRERKFHASGGVKRRLEKGGLASKGKFRSKRRKGSQNDSSDTRNKKPNNSEENVVNPKVAQQKAANDLASQENLGDMDMDSFFENLTSDTPTGQETPTLPQDASDSSSDDGQEEMDQTALKKRKTTVEEVPSSDSDDDDDDDDLDAAEERMRAEMAKMKEADPEFHEFLKENEEELLDFGNDEEDDEIEDDEMVDADDNDEDEKKDKSSAKVHLTSAVLNSLKKSVFENHGIKSMRKLVGAYRAACHLSDATSEGIKGVGSQYAIDSSKVFDELMVLCLSNLHKEFHFHLLGPKSEDEEESEGKKEDNEEEGEKSSPLDKPIPPKKLEKSEKWGQMELIIQNFFRATLHVMTQAKEPDLLVFVLKSLATYNRYLTPFPKIASLMLKTLTSLWSAPLDTSEKYQSVRLHAFFRIRQLALIQPFPFIEDILKKTYLAYARRARFGTGAAVSSVLPTLTFMGNCLCELYSLDHHSSYQHAFVYIRQLALLLRAALHKKTPEAVQQIYCWQFVHCLKLWVAILCDSTTEEDSFMRSLIFPLTEVIMGTIRFIPAPTRNLPYKLHCVRLLQQLAAFSGTFIPTSGIILECLDLKEWYMRPKKTDKAAVIPQMEFILKLLPKEDSLRTHEQLEASMQAVFLVLNRDIELYRYSPAFPEYSAKITQRLRTFSKECSRQARWRSMAKSTIETCEKYSAFCLSARGKLNLAPKDVKYLECLRPSAAKTMRERHEDSVEREKKITEARLNSEASASEADEGKQNKKEGKRNKQPKKQIQKTRKEPKEKSDEAGVLDEEDAVQEGIDWSDEE